MAATEFVNNALFNDANLQAYYKLEDANDNKNANNLTNNNSCTFTAAKFNNGVNTNTAASGYLSENSALSASSALSFGGWMQVVSAPGSGVTQCALYWGQATNKADVYILYVNTAGVYSLQFFRTRTNVADDGFSVNHTLPSSGFDHVWIDWDGTTLTGYINGVSVGSTGSNGNGSGTTNNRFAVGAFYRTSPGSIPTLLIDDVPFFNRSLTPTEVASIALGSTTPTHNFFTVF